MLDPLWLSVLVDRRAVPSDVLCLDARSLMRTWGGVKEQQEEEDRGGGREDIPPRSGQFAKEIYLLKGDQSGR